MEKVGKGGVITVDEAKFTETTIEVVEGMQFDRGHIAPSFVTDPDNMDAALEDALIRIHEKKISAMKDLLPILEKMAQMGRSLLVVANDIEGESRCAAKCFIRSGVADDDRGDDRRET